MAHIASAVVREPFFHFLLLGALLWGVISHAQHQNDPRIIRIGPNEIRQITEGFQAQYGKRPSVGDVNDLLRQYVDDEVAFREGAALGLGQGDQIVRRRIIQKYRFLQNDLSIPRAPSVETLRNWFASHRENYLQPPRASFSHLYFSPDRAGDQDARMRAQDAAARLESGTSPSKIASDEFAGPENISDQTPDDAERLFGKSDLASEIFKVPVAKWQGPYRSGFGWHIINVSHRSRPREPAFKAVQDKVLNDYLDERQKAENQRAFAAVRSKYEVVIDDAARRAVMDEATR